VHADEAAAVSVSAAPGKGVTFQSEGDRFALTLRPRIQIRETITEAASTTTSEINVRSVRLWLLGHVLSPDVKFATQLAFGGGEFDKEQPSPVFDAYVEHVGMRDANVRVGQFFVPFDRGLVAIALPGSCVEFMGKCVAVALSEPGH
jgi:hypothetical protein